jgi:hemerythrin superfamily protein
MSRFLGKNKILEEDQKDIEELRENIQKYRTAELQEERFKRFFSNLIDYNS